MKSAALITIAILCMVPGVRSCADSWSWLFSARPSDIPEYYSSAGFFGSLTGASDDYDSNDYPVLPETGAHVAVYHETGIEGWTGPTGMWRGDKRAEVLSPVQLPRVWDFYVWMDPETPEFLTTFTLSGIRSPSRPPAFVKVSLQFVRNAVGAPVNPDVGKAWDLLAYEPGPGVFPPKCFSPYLPTVLTMAGMGISFG